MSEQELLRTALVLPPRARRVLCVWAAVPGLVCAPFAFRRYHIETPQENDS